MPPDWFEADIQIDSMADFHEACRQTKRRFIFRGHSSAGWNLMPRIERLHAQKLASIHQAGGEESQALTLFKSRARMYVAEGIRSDLEWLALMQHYGAPTRLLDWTMSPYVGLFFAIAEATGEYSELWAVDREALDKDANIQLQSLPEVQLLIERCKGPRLLPPWGSDPRAFDEWFVERTISRHNPLRSHNIIRSVEPRNLHERLIAQQGLFLCASGMLGFLGADGSEKQGFHETLIKAIARIGASRSEPQNRFIRRYQIQAKCRLELLRELELMNVTYATLFPGLDGFARSIPLHLLTKDDPW